MLHAPFGHNVCYMMHVTYNIPHVPLVSCPRGVICHMTPERGVQALVLETLPCGRTGVRPVGPSIFAVPTYNCSVQTHVIEQCFDRISRSASSRRSAAVGQELNRSVHLFSRYQLIIARYKHMLVSDVLTRRTSWRRSRGLPPPALITSTVWCMLHAGVPRS